VCRGGGGGRPEKNHRSRVVQLRSRGPPGFRDRASSRRGGDHVPAQRNVNIDISGVGGGMTSGADPFGLRRFRRWRRGGNSGRGLRGGRNGRPPPQNARRLGRGHEMARLLRFDDCRRASAGPGRGADLSANAALGGAVLDLHPAWMTIVTPANGRPDCFLIFSKRVVSAPAPLLLVVHWRMEEGDRFAGELAHAYVTRF